MDDATIMEKMKGKMAMFNGNNVENEYNSGVLIGENHVNDDEKFVKINVLENLKDINPFLLSKWIKNVAPDAYDIKMNNERVILLKAKNMKQVESLLEMKRMDLSSEKSVEIKRKLFKKQKRNVGAIYAPELLDLDIDDLRKELVEKFENIVNVDRIQSRVNGKRIDSPVMKIFFDGMELPEDIYVGHMKYKLRRFYPDVKICYRCKRYGHLVYACKETKSTCWKCGISFEKVKSINGKMKIVEHDCSTIRCVNCDSNEHISNSRKCFLYEREKAIIKIMVEEDIPVWLARKRFDENNLESYADAVKHGLEEKRVVSPKNVGESMRIDVNQVHEATCISGLDVALVKKLERKIEKLEESFAAKVEEMKTIIMDKEKEITKLKKVAMDMEKADRIGNEKIACEMQKKLASCKVSEENEELKIQILNKDKLIGLLKQKVKDLSANDQCVGKDRRIDCNSETKLARKVRCGSKSFIEMQALIDETSEFHFNGYVTDDVLSKGELLLIPEKLVSNVKGKTGAQAVWKGVEAEAEQFDDCKWYLRGSKFYFHSAKIAKMCQRMRIEC